ncbi:hypothetical protein Tco_1365088 [Tanacetum coccineum]
MGRMSSRPNIPRPSKRFFPPCIHCGGIDHLSNECLYYPIFKLCGSYDHDTNGHNRIISLEREINPRNPQHAFKKCEAYGSPNHTTTDHYDIEWFKKGKALQAKKAEALKSTRAESSNANRSKTPTKSHFVSKAFKVFNTRRQQTEETYHITFDESLEAIKFSKPSVDNINIAESERYPPDEYLHLYEPSQSNQTNRNDVSFIEPYKCPEPVVLETEVSSDQNDQTYQNDQPVQNDEILNDDYSEHSNHTNDEQIINSLLNTEDIIQISEHFSSRQMHSRTKQIDIRYHFMRNDILKGDIELHFIPIQYQLADIFTKPLDEPTFKRFIVERGMLNIDSKPEALALTEEN